MERKRALAWEHYGTAERPYNTYTKDYGENNGEPRLAITASIMRIH